MGNVGGISAMGIGGGAEEVFEYVEGRERKERLLVIVQLLTTRCDPFDPRFASFRFVLHMYLSNF